MTLPRYFVGLDSSADHFHAALGSGPWRLLVHGTEFATTSEGFPQFRRWLEHHTAFSAETSVCRAAPGVYGEALASFLVAPGDGLAVEPPRKVQRAFDLGGSKMDPRDSEHLAEYACREVDELQLGPPPLEVVEQLQVLLTTREQLVQQSTAQPNAWKALQRKAVRTPFAEQVHQRLITELKSQIHALEREIRRLRDQHPPFQHLLSLLLTMPGVGLLLAAQLLVLTPGATEPWRAAELASPFGLAPRERRRGRSVSAPATSRHYGPAVPRNLLHLAARSVSPPDPHFRTYDQRQVAEGNPKPLVLTHLANKLLKVICAVLESPRPYDPEYAESVH